MGACAGLQSLPPVTVLGTGVLESNGNIAVDGLRDIRMGGKRQGGRTGLDHPLLADELSM